ncbi:MAG: transporter, partial [Bacteroidota bacterium]
MTNRRLLLLAAAILCGLAAGARADDGDAISTDRPGFAESSQTVGKGRVQLETSLEWDRQRDDELHTRTLTTPTLLRIGVGDAIEL